MRIELTRTQKCFVCRFALTDPSFAPVDENRLRCFLGIEPLIISSLNARGFFQPLFRCVEPIAPPPAPLISKAVHGTDSRRAQPEKSAYAEDGKSYPTCIAIGQKFIDKAWNRNKARRMTAGRGDRTRAIDRASAIKLCCRESCCS
jgi:hypothetical protein